MRAGTFLCEIQFEQFLFEAFFDVMLTFSSVEPQSELCRESIMVLKKIYRTW